jgi:sugar diacid utilization regulator
MAHTWRITMPAVAGELVQRLTAALGFPFTLANEIGAVLSSTGGHPRGHIEAGAIRVLRDGQAIELSEDDALGETPPHDLTSAHAVQAGLLAGRAGVYVPVRIDGEARAVLIAHGPPESVRSAAHSAAAAVALALDFARGASLSARQSPGPDIALHQLLRGSPRDARRAALVAKVIGWDLTVPRVALVVLLEPEADATEPYGLIADFIDTAAPSTPLGQLQPRQWVLLPELSTEPDRATPRQLAEDVRAGLASAGASATIGLGEPHANHSLVALRRSYREAVFTAQFGRRLHGPAAVYQLSDLGAAAFLVPDPSTRRRRAERVVQQLRPHPDVLLTLQAFLAASLSVAATAEQTQLHRHTIRNHLDRVERLTGLNARVLDDALQLRIALLLDRQQ